MDNEDLKAEVIMYFEQIIELSELMISSDNCSSKNILTIQELAESAKIKMEQLSF